MSTFTLNQPDQQQPEEILARLDFTFHALGLLIFVRSKEFWIESYKILLRTLSVIWRIIVSTLVLLVSIFGYFCFLIFFLLIWIVLFIPSFYFMRLIKKPILQKSVDKLLESLQPVTPNN